MSLFVSSDAAPMVFSVKTNSIAMRMINPSFAPKAILLWIKIDLNQATINVSPIIYGLLNKSIDFFKI